MTETIENTGTELFERTWKHYTLEELIALLTKGIYGETGK